MNRYGGIADFLGIVVPATFYGYFALLDIFGGTNHYENEQQMSQESVLMIMYVKKRERLL